MNHFNWVFDAHWQDTGEDAWQTVTAAMLNQPPPETYTRELFQVFGRIPTPTDGHIADFLHHWRSNGTGTGLNPRYSKLAPKNMDVYRINESSWQERIEQYVKGNRNPMDDVDHLSGEGAIPIICATHGLTDAYDEISVNIPNRGSIPNLPDNALVEVPARISKRSIQGHSMSPLPSGVHSLVARQQEIAELAVEAAVEGNYAKALQALAIDPIIPDLLVARQYLDDILASHKGLTRFT